ncbi:MAG: ATP-binding protein [Bacteroidota bacterium]
MKIAVASGKGGTGKTTISVNLYQVIGKYFDNDVKLVDCDVEEPNDALFFGEARKTGEKQTFQLIPEIDTDKCTYCRKCADWCEFNAITIVKNLEFAEVNNDLCHSCGACTVACNFDAITEKEHPLGTISYFGTETGGGLIEGRLKVGSAMQTAQIKEVKKEVNDYQATVLYDAPPGTSCPVVETVSDVDYIILVTEPTPFGLHDLKITVDLLEEIEKPFGVIVNKAGLGSDEVYQFLEEKNIELLGKIPFAKEYASDYASGEILKTISEDLESTYREIANKILSLKQLS